MADQMWVVWVDANGQQTVTSINTSLGAGSILAALEALSNATPKTTAEGSLIVPGTLPTAADYISVRQVAKLTYTDGAGSFAVLSIPAPTLGIFGTDGDSIDPTAVASVTLVAIGNLLAGSGNPVTAFVSGVLLPGRFT